MQQIVFTALFGDCISSKHYAYTVPIGNCFSENSLLVQMVQLYAGNTFQLSELVQIAVASIEDIFSC